MRFLSIHPDDPGEVFNEGISRSHEPGGVEKVPYKEEFDEQKYYKIEPEDLPLSNEFRKMTILA